ncbi:MAG: hypothetical protein ABSG53_29155 [Thermoguttaceae bacterium]|jgi:hypothetical protein
MGRREDFKTYEKWIDHFLELRDHWFKSREAPSWQESSERKWYVDVAESCVRVVYSQPPPVDVGKAIAWLLGNNNDWLPECGIAKPENWFRDCAGKADRGENELGNKTGMPIAPPPRYDPKKYERD